MSGRRALIAGLAVLALVAAACGDRGEDESGTDAPVDDQAAAPAEGDFGDLEAVCGPNEGGGEVPTGDPAEVQGITADSISVGTVADPGFEGRPGLNQEIFDAATAFVEWCNAAGGINGKQLDLTLRDAAVSEYQPVLQAACREDFAIVGSGAVQDNFWPDVGAACGLIDVAAFSVTPEKAGTAGRDPIEARSVQVVPNSSDRFGVGSFLVLAEEFPEAAARAGIIYGDLETTIVVKDRMVAALEPLGFEFVHEAGYNILGEANWAPFAGALQEDGVEWLMMVGEGENLSLLLQAMDEIGYRPEVISMEANFYDQVWVDAAGPSADGVFVRTGLTPFEEADQNPATQQYLDLVNAIDGKVASLGAQAMSSWLLFAQSVKACDLEGDLTRSCVLEQAASVHEWTGGGLHAPSDPGSNETGPCGVILRIEDQAFTRYAPDDGFNCGEDSEQPFVVEVDF
jgi:ABC-type branched-subunit amino acid transport system substrate-binding protein